MASTASQWNRSAFKGLSKKLPKYLVTRFADYYKDAQGPRFSSNKGQSKTLDLSLKHNAETYIEAPESNRWIGADGEETNVPLRGAQRYSIPSTAIESIIVDKDTTKPTDSNRFKVSISFTSAPTKYYDYWATEDEVKDLMNAGSKGREVALDWNHNPEKAI